MNGSWERVCRVEEAVGNRPVGKVIDESGQDPGRVCVVALDDGGYAALLDRCPHRDVALSRGIVKDGTLICPGHFWRFDVTTGERTDLPERGATVYPTRVVDGWVEALLPPTKPRQPMREWLLAQARGRRPAMQEDPATSTGPLSTRVTEVSVMSASERAAGAQRDHVDEVALELDQAELNRVGVRPLTKRPSGLTREQAWSIASARDRLRAERGEVRTGYKLGWTSKAMRRALGIDEPNFGTLWTYMRVDDGILDLGRLIHPKAEPEIAYVADSVLRGAGITADDVVRGGRWAVAIEVVDPRWTAWDFDWLDNTADGSSAAAYVVGAFHSPGVRPETFRLTMEAGAVTREGTGEAAMDSPAEAVAYLVRQLHDREEALQPGMVVLTGGITAPIDLTAGLRVHVSSPELGSCDLRCS